MSEREWIPADLLDEVTPPLRRSPTDWVVRLGDGAPALAQDAPDDDDGRSPRALRDGDVVEFCWFENHGEASVKIAADGSWRVDREQPPEANTVFLDYEWPDRTLEGAVADYIAYIGADELASRGEPIHVQYCTWSEPEPFVFDARTATFLLLPKEGARS